MDSLEFFFLVDAVKYAEDSGYTDPVNEVYHLYEKYGLACTIEPVMRLITDCATLNMRKWSLVDDILAVMHKAEKQA